MPLEYVASALVFGAKPGSERSLCPLHRAAPRADLTVLQDQMEMVRHEAVREKPKAVFRSHADEQFDERGMVRPVQE